MTKTHMVRCKSIVEQTRVVVVDVMSNQTGPDEPGEAATTAEKKKNLEDMETDTEPDTELDTELETDTDMESAAEDKSFVDPNWEDEEDDLYMDVARVYERTLIQLGEVLQDSALP